MRRPLPEGLTRADVDGHDWTIHAGEPRRGDAWTNPETAEMRVPLYDDELSRTVRVHEMAHAKWSPGSLRAMTWAQEVYTPGVAIAVEELRVNRLLARAGFSLDDLCDGSERSGGERVARAGDWAEAVRFTVAVHGGKPQRDFLSGVAKVRPEWAKALRTFARAVERRARKVDDDMADTEPDYRTVEGEVTPVPLGHVRTMEALAPMVLAMLRQDGETVDATRAREVDKRTRAGLRMATGLYADLVEGPTELVKVDGGVITRARREVRANVGRHVRYPSALVRDPQRRVMSRRSSRRSGAVVLVDMSGSMSISEDELSEMATLSPDLTVLGYSHKPGDVARTPNFWVLADRGAVATPLPRGNVGNGVDLPALREASRRCAGRPLVWVCDGNTTDSTDNPTTPAMTREVGEFLVAHRVHWVKSLDDLVDEVRTGADLSRPRWAGWGRVGMEMPRRRT